ncbi:MAG: SRPBCC family protein [Rhodobacteraceae bacterium]|nr:SRPBCC family protein [Paracoccaceae bacterium]
MKLSTREDIVVPISDVFTQISDFGEFERRAMRRGAEISRSDPAAGPGEGSQWDASFTFRGKERKVKAYVEALIAPETLQVGSKSGGLDGMFEVRLVALSPSKTRMIVGLELKPTNLSARLLVQSLKLAKGTLNDRFSKAVSDFAKTLEVNHNGAQPRMTLS